MTVGVREFKNRATELLRVVESGKGEVIITRHSKPVARLVPSRKASNPEDEALDRLAALGLLRRGSGKPFNKKWRPIRMKGKPLSQIIIEDREDRF